MKICYFGTYERNYSRNRIVIKGLRYNGVEVIECNEDPWKIEHKLSLSKIQKTKIFINFFKSYIKLILKYLKNRPYDFIFVGYLGHFDIFLAKILSLIDKKPLIFDAYYSLYDSLVNDRKIINKKSMIAKTLHLIETCTYNLPNLILLDTPTHIDYCSREFKIKKEKFDFVPIGADEEVFYPRKIKKEKIFTILFWGKFIPLQGVDYIIKAAKILENEKLRFKIIGGGGQTYKEIINLSKKLFIKNVDFVDFIPYEKLPEVVSKGHIGLGIFGKTEKARRVVPNKAYEILALSLPLITGNSKASRELGLKNKENCILCNMADPKAIADSILLLKRNRKLRNKIAKNGYNFFKENFSTIRIGKKVKEILLNSFFNPTGR